EWRRHSERLDVGETLELVEARATDHRQRRPLSHRVAASGRASWAIDSPYGARKTPRSVTIAVIRRDAVTSNAGLRTGVSAGAAAGRRAIDDQLVRDALPRALPRRQPRALQ